MGVLWRGKVQRTFPIIILLQQHQKIENSSHKVWFLTSVTSCQYLTCFTWWKNRNPLDKLWLFKWKHIRFPNPCTSFQLEEFFHSWPSFFLLLFAQLFTKPYKHRGRSARTEKVIAQVIRSWTFLPHGPSNAESYNAFRKPSVSPSPTQDNYSH